MCWYFPWGNFSYLSQCKGGHDKKYYSTWQDLLLIGLFPYLAQTSFLTKIDFVMVILWCSPPSAPGLLSCTLTAKHLCFCKWPVVWAISHYISVSHALIKRSWESRVHLLEGFCFLYASPGIIHWFNWLLHPTDFTLFIWFVIFIVSSAFMCVHTGLYSIWREGVKVIRLFSMARRDNKKKLKHGRFLLNIRKQFFTV